MLLPTRGSLRGNEVHTTHADHMAAYITGRLDSTGPKRHRLPQEHRTHVRKAGRWTATYSKARGGAIQLKGYGAAARWRGKQPGAFGSPAPAEQNTARKERSKIE